MLKAATSLEFVYDGWDGYHQSIVNAVSGLTADQLSFHGSPEMPSVGELAWHIGNGRVSWFVKLGAPGSEELWAEMQSRTPGGSTADLVSWLERTWEMVAAVLSRWSVEDLTETYRHPYQGKVYAVSRQWTIWRIMAHDIHHGGQLSELLAMQGIIPTDLTLLGGHLTEPPVVDVG